EIDYHHSLLRFQTKHLPSRVNTLMLHLTSFILTMQSMWTSTVDRRADNVAISKHHAFNLLSCGGGARARKSFDPEEDAAAFLGTDCPVRDVAGWGHSQFL